MSAISPTQHDLIATSTVTWVVNLPPEHFAVATESKAIPPFRINVSEADFVDLRWRAAELGAGLDHFRRLNDE